MFNYVLLYKILAISTRCFQLQLHYSYITQVGFYDLRCTKQSVNYRKILINSQKIPINSENATFWIWQLVKERKKESIQMNELIRKSSCFIKYDRSLKNDFSNNLDLNSKFQRHHFQHGWIVHCLNKCLNG